jgi:PAS domain S-box-containing protein
MDADQVDEQGLRAELEALRRRVAELEARASAASAGAGAPAAPLPASFGLDPQSLLDLSGVMFVAIASDERVALVNRMACQVLECREEEAVGANWFDLFVPGEVRTEVRATFHRILSGELEPLEFYENEVLTRGGDRRVIAWHNALVRDPSGRVVATLSSGLDLTAQRLAEQALRRESDLLARLAATSPVAITLVDRTGRITFANRKAEETLGLRRDLITSREYNDPEWRITDFAGDPLPDRELPFARVMATGEPVADLRHAITWPDGRRVLLSVNATPLHDAAGQVEGMVATIADVTASVRAEAALRESEERLKTLFDGAREGMLVAETGARRFVAANRAMCTMLGVTPEEIGGLGVDDIHPREELPRVLAAFEAQRRGELDVARELPVRRRDGSVFFADISSAPVILDGRPCVIGVFRDVTERQIGRAHV